MTMDHRPRRYRPGFEGLEARDLPSALQVVRPVPAARAANQAHLNLIVKDQGGGRIDAPVGRAGSTPGHTASTPPWVNESLLQELASTLYAPVTTTEPIQVGTQVFPPGTYPVPQPTPAEVRRQTFWAQFVGTYYVGAPRFSNQASTIHIYSNGKNVTSNQFLNGRGQVLLFPPADPTATPTALDPVAGQVTGLVTLYPSNVLQSSSALFQDATNLPGVASNDPRALDHGLPSRLEVLLDTNGVNGGVYSTALYATTPATETNPETGQAVTPVGGSGGAVAFTQGAGFLDLKYLPDRHPRAGARQSGTVVVRIQGLINLTGVTNPLYKGIN
jgi:hypothetical protein